MELIDTLELTKFRAFIGLRLENLGKINLILGPNNSGKSSVLEALYILGNPMDFHRWEFLPRLRFKTFYNYSENSKENLDWFFPKLKGKESSQIQIKVESNLFPFRDVIVEKTLHEKEVAVRIKDILKYNNISTFGDAIIQKRESLLEHIRKNPGVSGIPLNRLELKMLLSESIQGCQDISTLTDSELEEMGYRRAKKLVPVYNVSTSHSKSAPRRLFRYFVPFDATNHHAFRKEYEYDYSDLELPHVLVKPNSIWSRREEQPSTLASYVDANHYKDNVVELLKEYDPNIEGYQAIHDSEMQVHIKHAKFDQPAPLSSFGEGLRKTYVLLAAAAAAKDGFLLVDEIETGLHYTAMHRALKSLILAARAFNVQLFIATHSLEAIDAIIEAAEETESLNEVVGYKLNADQSVQPKRIDGSMLQRLRLERGLEVR